jgi:signal peptidase I
MSGFGRFLAWTTVIVGVGGGLLRYFVFEPWTIPDDEWIAASSAPTLSAGDAVLLLTRGVPGVGDLVRCKDPESPKDFVIGRILGKGGDTLELGSGTLKINGYGYSASDACHENTVSLVSPKTQARVDVHCGRVEIAGGWHYMGRVPKSDPEPVKTYRVEPGNVFLVSDNRDIHDDSRDFGQLPLASCDRRVVFRAWSAKGWMDSVHRLTPIH